MKPEQEILELRSKIVELEMMLALHKHTERAYSLSENRLRKLAESVKIIPYEINPQTWNYEYVGPQAESILGYPIKEWYKPNFWINHIHPLDKDSAMTYCLECSNTKDDYDFIYRMYDAWDNIVYFHDVVYVERDESSPKAIRGFMINVTQQKKLEESLRANLDFVQQLIDSIPSPLFFKNQYSEFLGCNRAFEDFIGIREIDLIGKTAYHIVPEYYANVYNQTDKELLRSFPSSMVYESQITDSTGKIHHVIFSKATFSKLDGSIGGLVGIIQDITSRIEAEKEVRKLNRELEERVEQRTAELLESEKMASLGRLVAGVAHELNTPIGNSLTVASTIENKIQEFKKKLLEGALKKSSLNDFIDNILEGTNIMLRSLSQAAILIRDFKDVAVDQTSSQRRIFDLKTVIEEILFTISPNFKKTKHRLEVDLLLDIQMDSFPGPLGQVLTNLINNALIHGFEFMDFGTIKILTQQIKKDFVEIIISDNGKGIPERSLSKIFDPFYTTRMGKGGAGLGLHIVHNIVYNILGGKVFVMSVIEKGTEFTIEIPLLAPIRIKEENK